jgi:hypothetical protein
MPSDPSEITRLLHALEQGHTGAAEELAPLVYRDLGISTATVKRDRTFARAFPRRELAVA